MRAGDCSLTGWPNDENPCPDRRILPPHRFPTNWRAGGRLHRYTLLDSLPKTALLHGGKGAYSTPSDKKSRVRGRLPTFPQRPTAAAETISHQPFTASETPLSACSAVSKTSVVSQLDTTVEQPSLWPPSASPQPLAIGYESGAQDVHCLPVALAKSGDGAARQRLTLASVSVRHHNRNIGLLKRLR